MNDFEIGFCIGYVVAMIVGAVVEGLCILKDRSELDKWIEKDK